MKQYHSLEKSEIIQELRELLKLAESEGFDVDKFERLRINRRHIGIIIRQLYNINMRLERLESRGCLFSDNERDNQVIDFMVGASGAVDRSTNYLNSWLNDADNLIIIDPYFFDFTKPSKTYRTQDSYIESMINLLPKTLKDLDVFYSNGSPRCIRPFEKHCREKGIFFQKYKTSRVHDRVLIKNDNCAKVIGTSFGALGDKVSFILDLPSEDLKLLRQELHKIKTQT